MTKEQILNGMSEEDFYNLYPDQASWENAQQMKLGGLSGAPHNGQPTAKEFFSYGSHANDGINIPMGNPLYLAYGGIPMAQAGVNMTPQEWAKQEQLNLINRTGVQTPKNKGNLGAANTLFNPFADDSDVSDDQIDSSHVFPNNPNLASYFKGDKMIVGPAVNTPKAQSEAAKFNVGKIFKMKRNIFTPAEAYANYQENGGFIDYNNNTTYPTFSQGGYDYEDGGMMNNSSDNYIYNYGGSYDPGLQEYQVAGQVDYGKLADLKRQEKNNNMSIEGILSSFRPGEDTTAGPMGLAREKARAYQIQLANKIKNHPDNIKKEEDGGSVINLINALTKAKKKAYGGANSQPGGNQSHIENLRSTFDGIINNNVHNALINEQADAIKKEYGGLMKAQDGVAGTAVDPQVKQNAFKQNVDKYDNALNSSFSDLVYSNKRNNYYPNYYQGMNYMPMNYSPMNKISKEDDAMYKALQKNPSSRLTGYKNKSYLNGLFGKTEFTFGYKDQNAGPIQLKGEAATPYKGAFDPNSGIPMRLQGPEDNSYFRGKSKINQALRDYTKQPSDVHDFFRSKPIQNDNVNTDIQSKKLTPYQIEHRNDAKYNIDLEGANIPTIQKAMDNSVEGKNETQIYRNSIDKDLEEKSKEFEEDDKDFSGKNNKNEIILSPQRYGGLYKAQYGKDHNSKNPMDGTYDNYSNIISSGTNGMTGGWGTSFTTPQSTALAGKPTGNITSGMTMSGVSGTEANDKLAPILKDATTNTANETGEEKQVKITSKQRPNFNHEAVVNWTNTGMDVVSNIFNKAQDRSQEQLANMQLGDNSFNVNNQEKRGDYDMNSGDFRPDQVLNTRYGGYMQQGGYPQQSAQQPNQEQIVQGVAQMLQQGAQPEEIAQQLIQMGLPQEEAMQLIQAVMQQLQGGQEQQPMQYGGYSMDEEDEESYEDDLTEDEIAELRNGGYNVQYI